MALTLFLMNLILEFPSVSAVFGYRTELLISRTRFFWSRFYYYLVEFLFLMFYIRCEYERWLIFKSLKFSNQGISDSIRSMQEKIRKAAFLIDNWRCKSGDILDPKHCFCFQNGSREGNTCNPKCHFYRFFKWLLKESLRNDAAALVKECHLIKCSTFSGTGIDVSPKLLFSFALCMTQVKQQRIKYHRS